MQASCAWCTGVVCLVHRRRRIADRVCDRYRRDWLVGLQGASDADGVKDPAWAVIGLIECTALPLAVRSLWPLPVLGITLAAAVAGDLLFDGLQFAGPVIALYTVARRRDRRVSSAAAAITAVGLAVPTASRAAENPLFA